MIDSTIGIAKSQKGKKKKGSDEMETKSRQFVFCLCQEINLICPYGDGMVS